MTPSGHSTQLSLSGTLDFDVELSGASFQQSQTGQPTETTRKQVFSTREALTTNALNKSYLHFELLSSRKSVSTWSKDTAAEKGNAGEVNPV